MPLASLLVLAALAFATPDDGPFYLEGPATTTRADAAAVVREAADEGYAARVVRRYRHGGGWEYLARVEGFADEAAATEAARSLAVSTGRSVAVYTTAAEQAVEVTRVQGAPPAVGDDDADPGGLSATEMLGRIARAHGGDEGGAAAIDAAERVLYRFRRTVPGGPVVEHTWARRGADLYLQIDVVSGEATPSRAWLIGGEAFLATGEGAPVAQDATRTREVLDRFSPEYTLGFPLKVGRSAATRPELQMLHRDGKVEVDGASCERLRYDGEHGTDAVSLAVDPKRWLLRQVELGSAAEPVLYRFRDYRDLGNGLVVPFDVRTFDGGDAVDEVEVLELDLAPRLPDAWFDRPAG